MHKLNVNIITSEQLISMLDTDSTVVVVDCRSTREYETSHIRSSVNIGGTRILRRDIMSHKISVVSLITSAVREFGGNRAIGVDDTIILYDQCSCEPLLLHNQLLVSHMLDELVACFNRVYFLQGGFIGFQSKFISYCWVNKHKLPDEDFVTPSQSMSQTNQSSNRNASHDKSHNDKSIRKPENSNSSSNSSISTGQSLTRSHTMMALIGRTTPRNEPAPPPSPPPPPMTICLRPDNHHRTGKARPTDVSGQQHSLSGPALPFGNQGPTTVLKHLLLGSQKDAMNHCCIQQYKISHVINVSTDGSVCPFVASQNFLRIPVLDNFTDKITHYFPKAFEFLDNVKAMGGRALVHCSAGISRSPTLAIGYLMKTQNISVTEAYNIVKLSRSSVSPNFNFMGQLTDYEEELNAERDKSKVSSTLSATLTRPKRRPSRLGFLSTFLRQSISSTTKSNLTVSPTSDTSSFNSNSTSLTAQKLSTPLLPSPSVPFAKLGINSPLDEIPNFTLKIDNFPSTSLDQLHFQPCHTGPRGVKVKRSATESGNDSSKIRKRLSMLDSYSVISSVVSPTLVSVDDSVTDVQSPTPTAAAAAAINFHRRHSSVFLTACSSHEESSTSSSPNKSLDRDLLGPSARSISYERLNCAEANWNPSPAIISDSCRLQECHQSTSSLSSANSHSSNLLV